MAERLTPRDVTARAKYRPVRPIRVSLSCDVTGCAGYMEFNGSSYSNSFETVYDHTCSMCGLIETVVNEKFPRIDYVEK